MDGQESVALREYPHGGYLFIPGVSQYSAGVGAAAGHTIRRVRFARPVPLKAGFDHIRRTLEAQGRPLAAFCACELRIGEPFTEAGFKAFNDAYIGTLDAWGLIGGHGNPVARSCVSPEVDAPDEPSFYAFSYTVPAEAPSSFVVAGSGEVPEGRENYRDHIVRLGDLSADALAEKAAWVVGEMERRMGAFGAGWRQATDVQAYTVHDLRPILSGVLTTSAATAPGVTWHFARPPIVDVEYEMDCRRIHLNDVHEV